MGYTDDQARAREVLPRHTAIIAMLMRGVTGDIGDDKEIAVNNHENKRFSSRGQIKD